VNVAIVGTGSHHCRCLNVESANAHIGFAVGGIIGSQENSFAGQDHALFRNCFAHDTTDVGFALAGRDSAATETNHGCSVSECRASGSLTSAGIEVRFQSDVSVRDFQSENHLDPGLGAGLRVEQAARVAVLGLVTRNCTMGLQVINDSSDVLVEQLRSVGDGNGALLRATTRVRVHDFRVSDCRLDGILLATNTDARWRFTNTDVSIVEGRITGASAGRFGYGIHVQRAATTASPENDTSRLEIGAVHIRRASAHGTYIESQGAFSIVGCVLEDNGIGARDAIGILVDPHGRPDAAAAIAPAGYVADCLFISRDPLAFSLVIAPGAESVRVHHAGRLQVEGGRVPGIAHQSGPLFTTGVPQPTATDSLAPALRRVTQPACPAAAR
jgi:hypothetical protein